MANNIVKSVLGVDMPEGVPPALAISVATGGYSEAESRQMMIEGGDAHQADRWIQSMKRAGFFGNPTQPLPSARSTSLQSNSDPGSFLWDGLLQRLSSDENGFKHQAMVLDNCIKKSGGGWSDRSLVSLHKKKAGHFIPFIAIADNCPWNGCKFVASTVMHMISAPNASAKQDACRTANRSIGGCKLPADLPAIRWPYSLSDAFDQAAAVSDDHSTALFVNVMDVEIMNNPAKGWGSRPGTFAHVFVMTISKDGVYLFQAYGPRGYTLLQYMEANASKFPLSLKEARSWVDRFNVFAADFCGKWTEEVNEAYKSCFDVDLVKLGTMKVGSQMDMYVKVEETRFDTETIRTNFGLLPQPDFSRYPPCGDGAVAKSKQAPPGYAPDGGVPHYYVPVVLRCGKCGTMAPMGKQHNHCARCKKVFYCSRECQVSDWKLRHKTVCKQLGCL